VERRTHLEYLAVLGREIRRGSPDVLGTDTLHEVRRALEAGELDQASRWFTYLAEEPRRLAWVYRVWLSSIVDFAAARMSDFEQVVARLEDLLEAPIPENDGSEVGKDAERSAQRAIAANDGPGFEKFAARMRLEQQQLHDHQTDWVWALYSELKRELGESSMEEVFRATLEPWVAERYATLHELSEEEKFVLSADLMRGHWCGPTDDPHFVIDEEHDRWILSFDPCGSGGRMRRGDAARDQSSRSESPYSFAFTEEAHPWTWSEKDVCLYCAHCAFVNEILPIEKTGAPLRVTEYPRAAGDRCRWILYKATSAIPDVAYTRVGKSKPQTD
jgi:hypothetical protein